MESVFQGALFVILLMTVETTVTNHEQMAFKNAIYFCKKLCMYVCVFARVSVHFHSREGLLLRVVDDNNFFRYDLRGLLISYQNQKTH